MKQKLSEMSDENIIEELVGGIDQNEGQNEVDRDKSEGVSLLFNEPRVDSKLDESGFDMLAILSNPQDIYK